MNVFITGGTGFIGSHIVKQLLARGHRLHILARNPDKIPCYRTLEGVTLFPGCMEEESSLRRAMTGCDAFIHLASCAQGGFSDTLQRDVLPTVRAFELAAEAGIGHVIYTSTTCVAGDAPGRGEWDALRPGGGGGPAVYAAGKSACEHFLLAMAAAGAFRANIIRPGFTFGNPAFPGAPAENPRHIAFIGQWLAMARAGGTICVGKDYVCQFLFAGYTAEIYAAVLESSLNRRIFYALDRKPLSMQQIAQMVTEEVGHGRVSALERDFPPPDDVVGFCPEKDWVCFDTAPLQEEFGLCFDSASALAGHIHYAASVLFPAP